MGRKTSATYLVFTGFTKDACCVLRVVQNKSLYKNNIHFSLQRALEVPIRINTLKPETQINDIEKNSSRTEDTLCLHCSDQKFNVLKDIIAFFRIIRT
jgi:hypothetical protein